MTALLSAAHDDPMWMLHLGLLAVQVSVLVLTGGIFVSTMISAYGTLSLLRRTLSDITRISRALEVRFVEEPAKAGIIDLIKSMGLQPDPAALDELRAGIDALIRRHSPIPVAIGADVQRDGIVLGVAGR